MPGVNGQVMSLDVNFITNPTHSAIQRATILCLLAQNVLAAGTALLGWSETALHETDGTDVSVYAIAPPYNTIHAQLIVGGLLVTNATGISVSYQAVADLNGSINSTSLGKGNFYQYAQALFGKPLAPDQGLDGFAMPGKNNQSQPMTFDAAQNCFTASGIPITPYDDQGRKNYYPLMRLIARDSTNNILASTDIVLPVSDEMDCRACHASGSQTEARPPSGWAWHVDAQKDYKLNVLRSHDDHLLGSAAYSKVLKLVGYNQAGLVATVLKDAQPVLCVRCHGSAALPGTGAPAMRPLTQLMHTKHSYVTNPRSGEFLTSSTNSSSCLLCHAGPEARLMRGVHHNTIATNGSLAMQCQSCHGSISAVGAAGRKGWVDEPKCQSCHTGAAVNNSGALRFSTVFDGSGQIRQPANLTYATETNVPTDGLALFRASHGHGGINCAACHGSAHAEWLSTQTNDNLQGQQLQSNEGGGVLTACSVCHVVTPSPATGGPHGMHPVDSRWASNHDQGSRTQCQTCHGADYRGTVISWAQGNRTYGGDINSQFWHGFQIGCYTCHAGPNGGELGFNTNVAPSVPNLPATTLSGSPIQISVTGSDPNGNSLSYRVVTQPIHGTVSLTGNTATYFPEPGFVGNDSLKYAAWDGSTDSKLGTVALTVTAGACLLSASALVPTAAFPNSQVPFSAIATLTQCAGSIAYDWDFGDGSPHGSGTNVSHIYPAPADYAWTLTVTSGGSSQTVSNVLTISPTLGPPLILTATYMGFALNLSWPADSIPTALETATDPGQPYAWQPDADPVYFDGTNNKVQIFFPYWEQLFRVRRLP